MSSPLVGVTIFGLGTDLICLAGKQLEDLSLSLLHGDNEGKIREMVSP